MLCVRRASAVGGPWTRFDRGRTNRERRRGTVDRLGIRYSSIDRRSSTVISKSASITSPTWLRSCVLMERKEFDPTGIP